MHTITDPASIADYIDHAITEDGSAAWIKVEWHYRHAAPSEVHIFVDAATHHVIMRDLWLQDPRHAADLAHEVITADLYAYGETQAALEDAALHDLIGAWVREHDLTAVSS